MLIKESLDSDLPITATTGAETLNRSLSLWNSLTIGFATVSPVAGLYAIIGVQTVVTGGGWFGALARCLVMQMLVATVYAELSSQIPIAGGAYKWARQLGGATTGKYAGVIYVSSTIAMLTTTAYTGGVWLALFFGFESGGGLTLVMWGAIFLLLCTLLNLAHVNVFKLVISLGVYAEIVGSFGVALLLFFFFRQHSFSELFQHLGTGTAPSQTAAFLAAPCLGRGTTRRTHRQRVPRQRHSTPRRSLRTPSASDPASTPARGTPRSTRTTPGFVGPSFRRRVFPWDRSADRCRQDRCETRPRCRPPPQAGRP